MGAQTFSPKLLFTQHHNNNNKGRNDHDEGRDFHWASTDDPSRRNNRPGKSAFGGGLSEEENIDTPFVLTAQYGVPSTIFSGEEPWVKVTADSR